MRTRLTLAASMAIVIAFSVAAAEDANQVTEILVRGQAPTAPASQAASQAATKPAATPAAAEPDVFRIGFFPSANAVRFFVNAPKDATAWKVTLRAQDAAKELAAQAGAMPFPAAGVTMKSPALAQAGKYELTLTLERRGEPLVITRAFERKTFPWEGLKLGLDDVVVPPFTPLTVDANVGVVACVLRSHDIGTAGLWNQVTSEGRPLLQSPMRLEVEIGGKTVSIAGEKPKFTAIKPHRVAGESTWQAGMLDGKTTFAFDYDGAAEFKLLLSPGAETRKLASLSVTIDRMRLVIPMKAAEAWLMHPVTTLLRGHYAGAVPSGEGKVWDSGKISRHELPPPFVPYMWVGGPQRGVCWFADNDKGCSLEPNTPAMELHRQGDTLTLVVNLVTRPITFATPRTITFGLQATPAKPMPQDPDWRRWWPLGTGKNVDDVNFNMWGATMYWGARGSVTDFWPAHEDYTFFDELQRLRSGGKADANFLPQWMAKLGQVKDEDLRMLQAHYNAGLTWASITPFNDANAAKRRYVLPYTSARSMAWSDAYKTYLDEWNMYDVADARWDRARKARLRPTREQGAGVWYEIDPADTYIDMVLYYHRMMYAKWADGIYWDNFFLTADYVPDEVGGPGYVGDDGRLHPGVRLSGFRQLAKRNAVMMHQMGKRPLEWVHMTNVNIVPFLSFATINYDWEWRDLGAFATKDLQDRLGCDGNTSLILAMSTGLQSGNIGVACDRFTPPKDSNVARKWLVRTVLAVCLPHEMKFHAGDAAFATKLLEDFGYGLDDCKVYRYWEPNAPLVATGADVRALVLGRGARAMLVVGSFGQGGDCTLQLDLAALKLPHGCKARNAETGQELTAKAPGLFVLPIVKHDVAFVVVE